MAHMQALIPAGDRVPRMRSNSLPQNCLQPTQHKFVSIQQQFQIYPQPSAQSTRLRQSQGTSLENRVVQLLQKPPDPKASYEKIQQKTPLIIYSAKPQGTYSRVYDKVNMAIPLKAQSLATKNIVNMVRSNPIQDPGKLMVFVPNQGNPKPQPAQNALPKNKAEKENV